MTKLPPKIETRYWLIAVAALLLFSVLRGIRFPNLWTYTHYLFSYDAGFVKRGLIGEIASRLNQPYLLSYDFFVLFSGLVFLTNMCLIFLLLRDLIKTEDNIARACALVFAASLSIVYLSHFVGHFDHLGLFTTLVTLRLVTFKRKMVFLTVAFPLILLVHEATLIFFFPVIFLSVYFSIKPERYAGSLALLLLFSAVAGVLTLFMAESSLSKAGAGALYSHLQAGAELSLREDAFNVLHRSSADNLQNMKQMWLNSYRNKFLLKSLMETMPTLALFIVCLIKTYRSAEIKPQLIFLAVLASLAPLLLNAVAWDMERFQCLAILSSFLCFSIAFQQRQNRPRDTGSAKLYLTILLVFVLNISATIELFDDYAVKNYPFIEHIQYFIDLRNGSETFPITPRY